MVRDVCGGMGEVKSMVQFQTKKASKAGLGELKGEVVVTVL
jgi:hypothetical protein